MEEWLWVHCQRTAGRAVLGEAKPTSAYVAEMTFSPTESDAIYHDRMVVVSTDDGTGVCGCPHRDIDLDVPSFMDAVDKFDSNSHSCLQIALVDAIMTRNCPTPTGRAIIDGPIPSKAVRRASLIVDSVTRLCRAGQGRVVMVGAVGSVIQQLKDARLDLSVTEMDDRLIGSEVAGVLVMDGAQTTHLIEEADVAVVTGMTIATETLGSTLEASRNGNTPLVFYAQTGSNILSTVEFPMPTTILQESFPPYMWPGRSCVSIFRYNE